MLVLDDSGVRDVFAWVVDHHQLLVETPGGGRHVLLLEPQRSVLELGHPERRVVRINLPGVHEQSVLWESPVGSVTEKIAVQPNRQVWIAQQHVLEYARVPARRQRLVLIREVPIVRARPARQAHQHGRVKLLRILVPLLLGVVPEDLLVQPRAHPRQRRLLAVRSRPPVGRRHALGVVPRLHLRLASHVGILEQRVDRLLRGRYGHQFCRPVVGDYPPFDPVVERQPLAELLDVPPHAFVLGVEQVRAVLAAPDAVGGDVVVAVTAEVVALVDHQAGHAELARAPLGEHGSGEAGADDEEVDVSRAGGQVPAHDVIAEGERALGVVAALVDAICGSRVTGGQGC